MPREKIEKIGLIRKELGIVGEDILIPKNNSTQISLLSKMEWINCDINSEDNKLNKINLFFPESLQRREELPPRWHSEPLQKPFHLTNRGRNFPTTCSFGGDLCC